MAEKVPMEEMIPAMLETLSSGGRVIFTVTGNSMLPMLHSETDEVTLMPPAFPLPKYSLPLYLRRGGKAVLHRVVGRKADGYIIRGDNCNYTENIPERDVIAVVESFRRRGKNYTVNDIRYKIYCRLWANDLCYFFRKRLILYIRAAGSRVKRLIIKRKNPPS